MRPGLAIEPRVTITRSGSIATITLGGGTHLNALWTRDWQEMERLALAVGDDESVSCVVVRGLGPVFCAGSDLHEWVEASAEAVDFSFVQMERTFQAIEAIPVPTVAFVERIAAGAGCQLALACDLQIISESAEIGMPISRLGILVPHAFAYRLAVRVGPSVAKTMLFGGALLSARDAQKVGLVTHAPPDTTASEELEEMLRTWSSTPVSALRAAKAAVGHVVQGMTRPATRDHPGAFVGDEFPQRVATFLARSLKPEFDGSTPAS